MSSGENERVETTVVSFMNISVMVILSSPEVRGVVSAISQTAEGSPVSPWMVSETVQVRERSELPATSGPEWVTAVSTDSGSSGTAAEDVDFHTIISTAHHV